MLTVYSAIVNDGKTDHLCLSTSEEGLEQGLLALCRNLWSLYWDDAPPDDPEELREPFEDDIAYFEPVEVEGFQALELNHAPN